MIGSALVLLLSPAATESNKPPPIVVIEAGPSDADVCKELNQVAAATMKELPKMVDTITRLDGMSVLCSLRTVSYAKFIGVDVRSFRQGWWDRKQAQWNDLICRDPGVGPLAKRGWRFVQNLTFRSGERYVMDAHC